MAIFKVPRISSSDRVNLILEQSEVVFDTDENEFFGGDGSSHGGFSLSGNDTKIKKELIVLNTTHIISGTINLELQPVDVSTVRLIPEGGIEQRNGIDFIVSNSELIFKDYGLDGFLEINETIIVYYEIAS